MATDENEPLLTTAQLCAKLQVCRETLRRMRKSGKIKEHRIGNSLRFKLSEVLGEAISK